MIKFRLDAISDTEAEYTFYPEGDMTAPGRARVDRATGDASIIDESDADFRHWYAGHMLSKLREMSESGNFEQTGIIAWW